MQLAISDDGTRIRPTKGTRASCPCCSAPVVAKCGDINVHHWAHESNLDCDTWSEPESAWHLAWKNVFKKSRTEIVVGSHRADIKLASGVVIELQHSPISEAEISEREQHYGNMVWLFDLREAYDSDRIHKIKATKNSWMFQMKWPRKHIAACKKPVYLDIGVAVLKVKWMAPEYISYRKTYPAGRKFSAEVGSYEDFLQEPFIIAGLDFPLDNEEAG